MRQIEQKVSPMSNEGRNAYVIEHLTNALLKLLSDHPIGDISISQLCSLAEVGRASFYRNFESKEDILRAYIDQRFREWIELDQIGDGRPLHKWIAAMFGHFEAHREFYTLLNKRNLIYLLKDVIIGLCGPKTEQTAEEAYASAFAAYTLYGWIEVWFQRGMQESAQEMEQMFQNRGL